MALSLSRKKEGLIRITNYSKAVCDYYKKPLPTLKINNRLKNSYGRFTHPDLVELSGELFFKESCDSKEALYVLLHELGHYVHIDDYTNRMEINEYRAEKFAYSSIKALFPNLKEDYEEYLKTKIDSFRDFINNYNTKQTGRFIKYEKAFSKLLDEVEKNYVKPGR